MTDTIYIIYPGELHPEDNCSEWVSVKPVRESFSKIGYNVEVLSFGEYTYEQLTQLPVPAGVFFVDVITFYASQKYADYLEFIKTWDTVFLNGVDSQFITAKKSSMYEILSNEGIDVPKTIIVDGEQELTEEAFNLLLENADIQYPVVVKPDFGLKGTMTQLCEDYNSASLAIDDIRNTRYFYCNTAKKVIRSTALVQEYVGDYPDMFVRVTVLPGHTGGYIFLTSPYEEEKFVNYNKHKFRVAYKVDPEIESAVKNAMSILGANAACCDLLITDEGGYKITDINCCGNLTMNVVQTGLNLFDNLASFMDEKIKEKRKGG